MASSVASTAPIAGPGIVHRPSVSVSASPVSIGLPSMVKNKGGVRSSMESKPPQKEKTSTMAAAGASLASVVFTAAMSSPAVALVDERMSTEGTGLPFGLSNNLLGWILLGVFALIWALYIVYTSDLEEDEESGLSL